MDVNIIDLKTKKTILSIEQLAPTTTIKSVKDSFHKRFPSCYPSRQSYRGAQFGKSVKDTDTLESICLDSGTLYFKDLGPQVAWSTVFYAEYAGPLVIYLLFYFRIPNIYGKDASNTQSNLDVVHIAAACHSFHYLKRLLETKFVHRFSHGTMPIRNLFKNCSYYWTFAAWPAYLINHPSYTPAVYGNMQVYGALAAFVFCELGNLSIHLALRDLRQVGSTERKIPFPTSNPFTLLFNFVSCPNYTYEVGAWISFAIMTQSVVGLVFATLGFIQMSLWALGKHRNYLKEFEKYPRGRRAIVPFLL